MRASAGDPGQPPLTQGKPNGSIELQRRFAKRSGRRFPTYEVSFVRDGVVLITLVAGDPLLRLLELPLLEVERLHASYAAADVPRPLVQTALDALLAYRRQ